MIRLIMEMQGKIVLTSRLHDLKDQFLDWFSVITDFFVEIGHLGLALYTIAETLLIIPPIEMVLWPLVAANPKGWLFYALNVIIFTFFSSAIGYFVGSKVGYPVLVRMSSKQIVAKCESMFDKYGILAVALVAFTPVPYTIAVFMAGISKMNFPKYMIAAMLGRTPRFLIGAYAAAYLSTTESEEVKWIAGIVGGVLVILYFIYDRVKKSRQQVVVETIDFD